MRKSRSMKSHSPAGTMSVKNCLKHIFDLFFISSVFTLCVLAVSCDSKDDGMAKTGTLRVHLTADTTSLKKGIDNSLTKAVGDEFEKFLSTDDYQVRIIQGGADDTLVVQSYERYDKMPSDIVLPEGSYTFTASKGENLPAAFDNPYFEGSAPFLIKEEMSTPLEVTCALGNVRITTDFTDDFKEAYTAYTVLLSSPFTTADFEIAKGEMRPAYMQVARDGSEIAVGIRLKKITDETEKTYYVPTPLKVERRQNIRLIFKTDGEALEGIGLTVMLDDEMEEKTFTTKIPDFMWQQFDKPTLTATDFPADNAFTFKSGTYADNPYIGITMPGGIASLNIKYWREGEDEEEAVVYDLATDEGVAMAVDTHYTWTVGEETDVNMAGRKTAVLYLQQGLNSLPSSDEETYTYHYKVYGTDATGKEYASNEISFDVNVLPADAPLITMLPDDAAYELVEGDELKMDWTVKFEATGLIDTDETKVIVSDGEDEWIYSFMQDDGANLNAHFGTETEITNAANATITFPKSFTSRLKAPETGSKVYTFTFFLKDQKQKEYVLTKTVTVYAPVFMLETTDNDAFAKRIVLRAGMSDKEDKKRLSFQYRPKGDLNWLPVTSAGMKTATEESEDSNLHYVDTLKSLTPETTYSVRAVYNANTPYARYSEEQTVTTEKVQGFRNGSLVDPLDEWSIEPDKNGSTKPGYNKEILAYGNSLEDPWRCWEVWCVGSTDSPSDWNTLNKKTTSDGGYNTGLVTALGNRTWTRYVANSGTIQAEGVSNSAALIRTVAWGGGTTAAGGASLFDKRDPGELYLGTYENGPQYGIDFTSRPRGFSFVYKYVNPMKGSDEFVAEMVVVDEKGEKAFQEFKSSHVTSEWEKITVYVDYSKKITKATKMYIRFVSGKKEDYKYADFPIQASNTNLSNGEYTGSHLYIDNVTLIYE